jgi:uncharacterized pyridoxamine 5'-phosphate oxidase family protein
MNTEKDLPTQSAKHIARVKLELKNAGMTSYGQNKLASQYLPQIIHNDEAIQAVIYGRSAWGSAVIVATSNRILYVEKRPLYRSTDDISYDVVSGVRSTKAIFTSVELHTRQGNYLLRYVNSKCADKFVKIIESHIEQHTNGHEMLMSNSYYLNDIENYKESKKPININNRASNLLNNNNLLTLATTSRTGDVRMSVVNYVYSDGYIYFLTKSDTNKTHNLLANYSGSVLVFSEKSLESLELMVTAEIVSDIKVKQEMIRLISIERSTDRGQRIAPVAQLDAGAFIVFRLTPYTQNYNRY